MKYFIIVVLAVLSSGGEVFYTRCYEKRFETELHRKEMCFLWAGYALANILTGMIACFALKESILEVQIRWILLMWSLLPLMWLDIKHRQISSHILIALLVVRIIFLIYELQTDADALEYLLPMVVLGAVIGGGSMLLVYAVSRGGLGFGDVKIFAVLGLYVGSGKILELMVYTFLFSALFGIVLLISRKGHLKDEIPMAPFAYIGTVLTCFFIGF